MATASAFSDLSLWWILPAIVVFALGRYFILAGLSYLLCYKPGIKSLLRFKIQHHSPENKQIRTEILYSFSTILVFSFMGMVVYFLHEAGLARIYFRVEDGGWVYLVLSLPLLVIIHDAYFYWTHRLFHKKWLFRKVHYVHHISSNPTPWAAYSFHPAEAFVESFIVIPLTTLLPVHFFVLMLFTLLVLFMNIMGHLGFEFIPERIRMSKPGQFFTSSTHHNLHHQKGNKNFGYYFTLWDRLCHTLKI